MLRPKRRHLWRLIAAAVLLGAPARAGAEEPAPPPRAGPEPAVASSINLFLGGPGDLDALMKSLQSPDFVLLKGDEMRKLLERAGEAAAPKEHAAVVDAVAVGGTVRADLADLTVDAGITLRSDGPTWVPIRLDDQTVTGASEGGRELPLRVAGGGGLAGRAPGSPGRIGWWWT